MYKKLYKFSLEYLIKIRSHIGHNNVDLNSKINPYIYGTRHNINIFNINKLWNSFRYLFYSLSEMFLNRNAFLIVGTNNKLPMDKLFANWLNGSISTPSTFSLIIICKNTSIIYWGVGETSLG